MLLAQPPSQQNPRPARGLPSQVRFLSQALSRLRGWRADGAAAGLGLVAAASLPPLFAIPALFVALPGLLCLIDGAPSAAVALRRGFLFGLIFHLAGLYWVTEAILVMAAQFWWAVPLAVPALSAVLAAFIAVPCALGWWTPPGLPRVAVLAGAWVLGDLGRQFALTGFPWNPLGSVWASPGPVGLAFLQPAAWVGVGGLTLLTLWACLLPRLGRRGMIGAALLLAVWAGAGAGRLAATRTGQTPLRVVIVQGNVPEVEHRDHGNDPDWVRAIFDRHLRLAQRGMAEADGGGPVFVLWPETGSPYLLTQDRIARAMVADSAGSAIASLVGSVRVGPHGRYRNSLVAVAPDGSVAALYDKHHLVPYGEYMPSYLPFRLGELGFEAGPGARTLHVPGLPPIGPLICYESIFSGEAVLRADRPSLLVVVTNDAWFGDSAGPVQHAVASRLRAVEEGLPVLRAANTGLSMVIGVHGGVRARLPPDRADVMMASVPAALPPTVFARGGLSLPLGISLASCCVGVVPYCLRVARGVGRARASKTLDQSSET